LIWFRWLTPIVLIVLVLGGWYYWHERQQARREENARFHALITAEVWLATARYRDDPEAFKAYRDSVLGANGISLEAMNEYIDRYSRQPEKYVVYARLVNKYIDSLENVRAAADTTSAADTTAADSAAAF
jgi:hypothetical protein